MKGTSKKDRQNRTENHVKGIPPSLSRVCQCEWVSERKIDEEAKGMNSKEKGSVWRLDIKNKCIIEWHGCKNCNGVKIGIHCFVLFSREKESKKGYSKKIVVRSLWLFRL